MSKAFLREDAPEVEAAEAAEVAPLPAGVKNYITRQGHVLLMVEYERLLDVERPEMVKLVAWAASNGDRSENGDYLYGKRRLREIDRRIRYLGKQLAHVVVVDPAAQTQRDRVFFGARVRVRDRSGIEAAYQIVGVDEAEPGAGRISWRSPLARALHKAEVGDWVTGQGPGGRFECEVLAIDYAET